MKDKESSLFPNYKHVVTTTESGIADGYVLFYGDQKMKYYEIIRSAYRSCPVCGASLRNRWRAQPYECTCSTEIRAVMVSGDLIVTWFKIPIVKMDEDII